MKFTESPDSQETLAGSPNNRMAAHAQSSAGYGQTERSYTSSGEPGKVRLSWLPSVGSLLVGEMSKHRFERLLFSFWRKPGPPQAQSLDRFSQQSPGNGAQAPIWGHRQRATQAPTEFDWCRGGSGWEGGCMAPIWAM